MKDTYHLVCLMIKRVRKWIEEAKYIYKKDPAARSVFEVYFRSVPESTNPVIFDEIVGAIAFEDYVNPKEGTYNEASFFREYESRWSGSVEDAFFNGEHFDRNRKLLQPEYEHSGRSSSGAYYVLSMDVGRKGCDSVICVFKVTPQAQGASIKSLVNIYTMADAHMED